MSTHGLKSSKRHPYQLRMIPFWRFNNLPPTLGYSEETKQMFERQKEAFDYGARFIQWEVKPQLLFRGEHIERMFESKLKRKI